MRKHFDIRDKEYTHSYIRGFAGLASCTYDWIILYQDLGKETRNHGREAEGNGGNGTRPR